MDIHYTGEHLIPGMIGKSFIWIAFLSAIIATALFFITGRKESRIELRKNFPFADLFFLLHAYSLLMVTVILYTLIFSHYFEYAYVWQYSSKGLPFKYIISCFWAGQEGSILIWTLFQAFIGVILLYTAKRWKTRVLSVVSLSQVFITSMMLGLHYGLLKIGGSPFELLRETIHDLKGTIFENPDYVRMIGDGNGLNPLLENIWMTIHPPILFLGYALSLVPFSYAIASLLRKEYFSWIRPALPWTIISLTFLGAGILLGGAWAYVSLTFGGFWSWDPVENSSLVPWLTLVAGLHFLLVARKQNHGLLTGYIFICLTYVFVLYASFLTRSGILATTSAHSFGDNGMTIHLLVFMLVFLLLMIVMILLNARKFHLKKEEIPLSREFFMLTGGLVIILAAFQVIVTTSIPVFNSVFGTNIAPPADRAGFYNRWQLPFALLVSGFIAFSQFLNYNLNPAKIFFRKMIVPLVLALMLIIPLVFTGVLVQANYILMVFFALFAVTASLNNMITGTSRPRNIPGILTHLGFTIFLLGTVLTFSNSKIISTNTSRFDLGDTRSNSENLMLVRGDTLNMGGFYVVYKDNTLKGNVTEYKVDFLKLKGTNFVHEFSLYPSVNKNPRMGNVYNPDTRHFLSEDYYTYISYVGKDPDYIVVKVIKNPYINILWFGAIFIIAGLTVAFFRRIRRRRISNA